MGAMRKAILGLGSAILLGLLPLTACKKQDIGSATEQAAREFALLQEELMQSLQEGDMSEDEAGEIDELLAHFARTADARYATAQSGLTLLHLACMYTHAELVRCLLQDGANPHLPLRTEAFCGIAEPGATPLLLAVHSGPPCPKKEMLTLIGHLLREGVKVNMLREGQLCTYEEVYLALLEKAELLEDDATGEGGFPISIARVAAECGWPRALSEVIRRRQGHLTAGDRLLLHVIAACAHGEAEEKDCAQLLLDNGVGADTQDTHGATPLFALTTGAVFQSGEARDTLPLAELLLSRGADPHRPAMSDPEYPGFTPYDFMLTKPDFLRGLKERGFDLQSPPINWESDNLPREICRVHIRESIAAADDNCGTECLHRHSHPGDQVSADTARHYDTIARILTPDSTMQQNPLYVDALRNAIELLARIDAPRAARLLAAMPLWQDALVWRDQHPHALSALQAVVDSPTLVLPRELILRAADTMEQQQQYDMAATMLELLGRCADAEADIARLESDPRPAMQAGALQARLLREKLPPARCYAVRDWLQAQGREADTPVLKKALLLTSQEDLWFGTMSDEDKNALLAAMEEVGAVNAARAYRAIADSLRDAEKLDELTADSHVWKFELESATARYFLANKAAFLHPEPDEKENTD